MHNYVDENNLNDIKNVFVSKYYDVWYSNKGEIKDALKGQAGVTEEDRPLTFMTDLSDNQNDIITYQPGIHTDYIKHKVYDVENVCAFIDGQGNIIDAALFILNEPATDQSGRILEGTQIDGAEESVSRNQYYSIGYGDPTDKQSIGFGWNTKKATITSSIDDSDNQRFLCLNIPSGHSQSGAPLVSEKHNKIVGVYEGGFATKISSIFDQITVFAALYDAGELE